MSFRYLSRGNRYNKIGNFCNGRFEQARYLVRVRCCFIAR